MNDLTVTAPANQPTIITERTFAAPRQQVFTAFTDKAKLAKWWIGPGYEINIERCEPQDGGRWRFVQTKDGETYTFYGNYHEVTAPERIIWTFEFEPMPERGHICLEKMEFLEAGEDRTKLRSTSVFFSVADRDGMLQSGMENGLQQSYEALDKVLAETDMAELGKTTITQQDNWVELSRVYAAPQALVFSMFKDPERVKQWWGPAAYPVTDCTIDFREGGEWRYAMTGPGGDKHWGRATYVVIDEPNRIVFQDAFCNDDGTVNDSLPVSRSTVTFTERDGMTTLVMHGEFADQTNREKVVALGMLEGMKDTWQQLEERLAALHTGPQ